MEKTFAKRYWPTIVGAIVGAIGGYLYWRYVGCSTDGWPIREHFAAKYHKKEQSR